MKHSSSGKHPTQTPNFGAGKPLDFNVASGAQYLPAIDVGLPRTALILKGWLARGAEKEAQAVFFVGSVHQFRDVGVHNLRASIVDSLV